METVQTGWESERDTERAKVNARWFAVAILFGALLWIRSHNAEVAANLSPLTVWILLGFALGKTIGESLYLWHPHRQTIPAWLKYWTVGGDMAFISALVYYTGYARSPFFFVYFVILISNCLRYGLLMSLYVAGMFNLLYVLVLGLAPETERMPSVLGGEGLKIMAFWAVALYGGAVSARLRRQANQLRVYEETIAELRARMGETASSSSESPPA